MKDIDWLNSWMDQNVMNELVQKLISVYHLEQCHFDVLLDLYGELVLDIYQDEIDYVVVPSKHSLLEKLFWKFINFQDKADRHQKKIQQMLMEEKNVAQYGN
jgi:hypothetical protein